MKLARTIFIYFQKLKCGDDGRQLPDSPALSFQRASAGVTAARWIMPRLAGNRADPGATKWLISSLPLDTSAGPPTPLKSNGAGNWLL